MQKSTSQTYREIAVTYRKVAATYANLGLTAEADAAVLSAITSEQSAKTWRNAALALWLEFFVLLALVGLVIWQIANP